MARRKKYKNKIILHPVMTFMLFCIIVIFISGIFSLFNISSTYNSISSVRGDLISTTEGVTSLLSLRGIKYIFSNTVSNFANFTVLSNLIIILLGIGVMEYSGFLKTAIGVLTKRLKKKTTTFVIVLVCLLSSILGNLPFIAFIPLTALIFKYGKRNPLLGVVASFSALTCGYGLSILFTSIDSNLSNITLLSTALLDGTYTIKTFSMLFIMIISIIIIALVITSILENYTINKLPKYDFIETEVLSNEPLTKSQQKGLVLAVLGSLVYLIIFIYNIIPGLPFSGNFLNYREALYIDKLFGDESFFANGFVFIVTMLFIIWGLLYGVGAKTIKNNREFVEGLGHSLNGIGKVLVYIFASATFISIFKQTNIGNIIVGFFASIFSTTKLSGIALIIFLFISTFIATIFVPSSITKWTILAPSVIPTFLNSGISAEFTQIIYRFAESAALGITPLFAYFIVYLAYLEKYNQDEKNLSVGSAIKYQLPFSGATAGLLLAILILWYIIGLPLGIGGNIAL